MKILKYNVIGYIEVYNAQTGQVEQQECISEISVMSPSDESIERAKIDAYNGEYFIEDDGQPEPVEAVTWDALAAALSEGVNSI